MSRASLDPETQQSPSRARRNLRLLGLGLGLFAGVTTGPRCGLGTDPKLLSGEDGGWRDAASTAPKDAEVPSPNADARTWVPEGIPPMDRDTHDATAVATFALG